MKKTRVSNIRKKRIGRPPVGAVPVMVRIPPNLLKALDKWKARGMSRPEAIRQLVEYVLEAVDVRDELAAIDAWIRENDPTLTRPAAIRRLVEIGLKAKE